MWHFAHGFGVAISPSKVSSLAKTTQTDFSCNLSIPTIITSIIEYWGTTFPPTWWLRVLEEMLVPIMNPNSGWGLQDWSHEQKQFNTCNNAGSWCFWIWSFILILDVVEKSGRYVAICHLFYPKCPFSSYLGLNSLHWNDVELERTLFQNFEKLVGGFNQPNWKILNVKMGSSSLPSASFHQFPTS